MAECPWCPSCREELRDVRAARRVLATAPEELARMLDFAEAYGDPVLVETIRDLVALQEMRLSELEAVLAEVVEG